MPTTLFTFDTTHHALWAEELARGAGIAALAVPAPPEARAACGLALELAREDDPLLARVLDQAGVPFGRFSAPHA